MFETLIPTCRSALLLVTWAAAGLAARAGDEVRFNRDIRPILSDNCFGCHGPAAKEAKAGLQLHSLKTATVLLGKNRDRRALVAGEREASGLWERISSTDPDEQMPPPDSNHQLSAAQIELIGTWIDQGAKYEGHWAFQPVVAKEGASVDSLVGGRLEGTGLHPAARANRTTLLRRLSQDLTGLPPTPEESAAFVADQLPDAYGRQVDRLLESPAAAERLAVDWLDGARYADTNGYSIDDHRDMWIWRDWVIHAFLTNKPFDEFTVEQVAGDLLPDATEQQQVATGFLRNSMNTHEGGTIAEEYRVTYNIDKVDTVATVFMGLTMKCSQCHDHKYDPISQEEFYGFYAFFNSSSESGSGATNANTGPLIEAGSPICPPDRVKRDVALRLADLDRLKARPPARVAAQREGWERDQLARLGPLQGAKTSASKPLPLFPDEQPTWIWAAADKTAEALEFQRRFTLKALPSEARIWVTCDNASEVEVNGKPVGGSDDWTAPQIFDVRNLQLGENTITVSATNGKGGVGGLLLSLAMRMEDGAEAHIVTDRRWETKMSAAATGWQGAAEIGKHGSAPWGGLYGAEQKGGGQRSLHLALATAPGDRSAGQWATINSEFAKKVPAFKTLTNQLALEEKILRKTADTGRATVMVMDYKPRKTHVLIRGAYDQHGAEVTAGTPSVLPPLGAGNPDGKRTRLDLARWLVDPAHPLTSRVIVNRYWQMLFGTGLVRTAEDFGAQGEYPSHPELLDQLAADFVASGWDLRSLLRQIVMSDTYQQRSAATPETLELDPYNRLLARAPRFRLSAEFVRDGALAAGGLLNRDLGGPSVHPYQPDGLWEEVSHYGYPSPFSSQKFLPGSGRALYRRSLYTAWKRTSPPPSMAIFDAPSRETCSVRRINTNTPLQALVLQNDPQFLEAARHLGELMAAAGSAEQGIVLGAERVLGRPPTQSEAKLLSVALTRYRNTYQARADQAGELLSSAGAGQLAAADESAERAAWTLIGSTLLNMDEAVTRQ
ncbi:MAG: mono/diheme cytochrome c family protein [Verrucomicrobiales bacterium]|jgi:mono/diheme cytochrome c family protein